MRFEIGRGVKLTVGSNPTLSAILRFLPEATNGRPSLRWPEAKKGSTTSGQARLSEDFFA